MQAIPTREEKPTGLHQRYRVEKLEGETDPRAVYLALRLDEHGTDPKWIEHCREAARTLAFNVSADPECGHLHEMACDLLEIVTDD